jgi:hypothetical protein
MTRRENPFKNGSINIGATDCSEVTPFNLVHGFGSSSADIFKENGDGGAPFLRNNALGSTRLYGVKSQETVICH